MNISSFTPSILNQNDYSTYAAAWVNTASDPDTSDLSNYFCSFILKEGSKEFKILIDRVNFKAGSIAQLLSTVGASNIKARFILQPAAAGSTEQYFSLVLFATDAFNTRLSSYYVSEPYWQDTAAAEALARNVKTYIESGASYNANGVIDDAVPVPFMGAIPDALAMTWVAHWYLASLDVTFNGAKLVPAIVNGSYGFLRGYTFDLEDFLAPLRQVPSSLVLNEPDTLIAIKLGLHAYSYANPNGDNVPTQTLGLIVQYPTSTLGSAKMAASATANDQLTVGDDGGSVFYDMSSPCPPSC
ncbi:hypothetical protein [Hymenobacter cheonanensis]|uniref:hypothetical protein n=1 Tax=Hymenobacter sp. CA2-7 TaxID=3063993 RepID=UPI0027135886|nr:hypothetical protein [Hymenobacter sp. CA2-7]MDO7884645.1 hypothetical protein [Hymenobacter sp. CA2-7]